MIIQKAKFLVKKKAKIFPAAGGEVFRPLLCTQPFRKTIFVENFRKHASPHFSKFLRTPQIVDKVIPVPSQNPPDGLFSVYSRARRKKKQFLPENHFVSETFRWP